MSSGVISCNHVKIRLDSETRFNLRQWFEVGDDDVAMIRNIREYDEWREKYLNKIS